MNFTSTNKITLSIIGMHCAGCVQNVERSLKCTPGVVSAAVNWATESQRFSRRAGQRRDGQSEGQTCFGGNDGADERVSSQHEIFGGSDRGAKI